MATTIQLPRDPQIGETIVFGGDGWELRPFPLPPSAITQIHTNTIMRIAMGETRSPNFVKGSDGWCIYPDGSAEFNNITARGTIYASAGVIGGWTIQSAYLAKDTGTDATSAGMAPSDFPFYAGAVYANRATAPFRVTPAGAITATSGTIGGWALAAAYIARDSGVDATSAGMAPDDFPFYAGTIYANRAAAPFRVTTAGALFATGATITGSITATSGTIGGWSITATQIKATADAVILDSAGIITVGGVGYLQSNPFTGGAVGWRITPAGAEFGNITARGEISTCVLTYNEVHVNAGILLVAPRAGKLASQLTVAANGSFDIGDAGRLLVNDIVRLKDSTYDRWLTVTADNGDGTYNYTLSSGAAGAVFNPGTAVASYGPSGAGGLMLNAVGPNGPFMDIFTHAGSPWTTLTTKVRVGNLAGIVDADLSPTGYGFYSDNAYLKGDLVAGGGKVIIDNTGIHVDIEGSTPSSGRVVFEDFGGTYDFWAAMWTYASGAAYNFRLRNRAATATYTTAITSLTAEGPAATAETVSEVYLSAPTGWSGLRAAAGTYAMVGVWDGPATVVRPKTTWNSGGNIVHKLFDAAGANKLSIQDSAEVEVAYINSDGRAYFKGGLSVGTPTADQALCVGGNIHVTSAAGGSLGYVYSDTANFGLLNNQGSWALYFPNNTLTGTFPGSIYVNGSIVASTPLGARARLAATVAYAEGWSPITLDTEVCDTDGCFAAPSTAIYAQHTGYYMLTGKIRWAANATGIRGIGIRINSASYVAQYVLPAFTFAQDMMCSSGMVYLTAGNYAQLYAYQNSGGNLNMEGNIAGGEYVFLSITRMA